MSQHEHEERRLNRHLIYNGFSNIVREKNTQVLRSLAVQDRELGAVIAYLYYAAIAQASIKGLLETFENENKVSVSVLRDQSLKELEAETFKQFRTYAADDVNNVLENGTEHTRIQNALNDRDNEEYFNFLFLEVQSCVEEYMQSVNSGDVLLLKKACEKHLQHLIDVSLNYE